MDTLIGILIPFIGTSFGATMVFLMKENINKTLEKALLGFSAGVMIATSIWSLLIPSIEESKSSLPAVIGFSFGIMLLIFIDQLITKFGVNSKLKNTKMLFMAVTLHNIPEGMAVGVIFAGLLCGNINIASAFALSIGIAIQNFPEGAIISMPLKSIGYPKIKAFLYGVLSGIVEPVSAIITLLLTNYIDSLLPYILSFAAGAMFYVVINELIPESQIIKPQENIINKDKYICTVATSLGFLLMMVLDVIL